MANKQDIIVTSTNRKVMIRMDLINNTLTDNEVIMLNSFIDKLKQFDRKGIL